MLIATTVAITVPGKPQADLGSGAFVAPGLVITCAHVVAADAGAPKADVVRGVWQGEKIDLHVVPEWVRPWAQGAGPDLALLRVVSKKPPEPSWVELCNLLEIGDDLWTYGYPTGTYRHGDSASFKYEGPSQALGFVLYKLCQGQALPGLSGAPVLNRRTGGVVGVVRASRDSSTDLGARLVTAASIRHEYGNVLAAELSSVVDRPWLDALTEEQLRAGHWKWPTRGLRDYLAAAKKQADDFPYAVPEDIASTLIDLYVQQKVTTTATDGRSAEEQNKQHVRHRKVEAVSALSVLSHRHAVLTGGPGAGKSSLFNYIVADTSRTWLDREPGVALPEFVPVRVSATRLAETPGPVAVAVADVLRHDLVNDLRQPLPGDFLQQAPVPGLDWLVLVDGIDEVLDPESRRELLARLTRSMSEDNALRIVIASRPLPGQGLGFAALGAAVYELQPFDPDQLIDFARKLFKHHRSADPLTDPLTKAREFISQLSNSSLSELCRTPLMATMTWAMYVDHPERTLPSGGTELYNQFVDRLLNDQDRRLKVTDQLCGMLRECPGVVDVVASLVGQRRKLIAHIAATRHEGSERSLLDLALMHLATEKPTSGITGDQWRELVKTLLIRSGLIGARGRELVFTHHTFQEYLTAEEIASATSPDHDDGRSRLEQGIRSNQQGIILFLAGQWALRGFDLSDAIDWLLRRGSLQVYLAAAIVADGVPVSTQCAELLVTSLGIMAGSMPDTYVRALFRGIASQLDDELLHKIADTENVNPLIRVNTLLVIGRKTEMSDVLPEVRAIMQDSGTTPQERLSVADLLNDRGLHSLALEVVRAEQERPLSSVDTRLQIVRRLDQLGAAAEVRESLIGVLTGEERTFSAMINAAKLLTRHDRALGVEWLCCITELPGISAYRRYQCADALADAGEADEACRQLRLVLRDPTADELDFTWSAESLYKLGFQDEAVATLSEMALDSKKPVKTRFAAVKQLLELAELDAVMTPALLAIRDNPAAGVSQRIEAATMLSLIGSSIDVVDDILQIARSPEARNSEMQVAQKLLELEATTVAETLLRETLDGVDSATLPGVAMALVDLGHWDETATSLRAIVHDHHRSIEQRCVSLLYLMEFRRDPADIEAVSLVAGSAAYPVQTRLEALSTLANLRDSQWPMDQLRHWASSREATISQRLHAAELLQQFDRLSEKPAISGYLVGDPDVPLWFALLSLNSVPSEEWDDQAWKALRAIGHRDDIPDFLREDVHSMTMHLLPRESREAATALARDASQPVEVRLEACCQLNDASDASLLDLVLREVTERADISAAALITAASLLVECGQSERALEVLRLVAADESAPPEKRCEAASDLLTFGAYDEALACWRDVLAGRRLANDSYIMAVEGLACVGLADEAVAAVRGFTSLTAQPISDRVKVAVQFTQLGRHAEGIEVLGRLSAAAATAADAAAAAAAFAQIGERQRAMNLHQVIVLAGDADENDRVTATRALCAHDPTGAYELIRHAVNAGAPIEHLAPAWAVLARYGYEHEAATFLRDIVYDRARPPGDRTAAAIALADSGSWLGEAISAIHMILREPGLTAKGIIAAGEFLSEAGEWSQAIALLNAIDIQQLNEELARRLARVPVRTLFHQDCTQQPTPDSGDSVTRR